MSIRFTYFIGLMAACVILAVSIYLQLVDGLLPCPLCTLQRFSFAILAVLFLFGILLYRNQAGRWLINILALVFSIIGIVFAGRQVWLQQVHPNGGECGVSLDYMLQVLPLNEVMQKVFAGSAECSQRGWEFLYLNMAEWALACFIGFILLIGYLLIKEFKWK